jgi:hypothetical protein
LSQARQGFTVILSSLPIALPIPGLTGNLAWYVFAAWFLLAAASLVRPTAAPENKS